MQRILVVEDSFSMRAFVRAALEDPAAGLGPVDVVEAATGFDALRLLPRGPYQLVISDINMPHINGLELVRFIRQSDQHRETRVLLISTQASERDRERGLSLGADGYLPKPFTPEELWSAVGQHLPSDAPAQRRDG
ncbi:MAG: response regulator [Myxococcales bacterium]|nr:response regulator [Myxococcales bacterium]